MKKMFLFVFCVLFVSISIGQTKKSFKLFNAMLYKNTPNLSKYGIDKLDVIYELEMLSTDRKDPLDRSKRYIDYNKIGSRVMTNKLSSQYVCLDIENWNTRIKQGGDKARKNYLDVINYVKKKNRNNKFGYFGVVPFPHYIEDYHKNNQSNKALLSNWKDNNAFLSSIYDAVDVYFPILYTSSTDLSVWENMVRSQIQMIKTNNSSKPIYGFIWPQFYAPKNKGINYQFIDGDLWYKQLQILAKYCDGAVIWGAPKQPNNSINYWNDNAAWWKATLRFIKDNQSN